MENGKFEITLGELKQIIKEEAIKMKKQMIAEKKIAMLEAKKNELQKQLNEMYDTNECGDDMMEEMDEGLWDKIKGTASNVAGNIRKDPEYFKKVLHDDIYSKFGYSNASGTWERKARGPWIGKVAVSPEILDAIWKEASADNFQGKIAAKNTPQGRVAAYKHSSKIGAGGGSLGAGSGAQFE